MKMASIFVTTGATVTFKRLIEITLDSKFISHVQNLGYTKLIVQYGSQPDGETLFKSLLEKLDIKSSLVDNYITGTTLYGFQISGFPFTNDVKSIMESSDLIISHAGTGSILDSLRLQKPLIVVINTNLMNNHQLEIANELENSNHLIKSSSEISDLLNKIDKIQITTLVSLPKPDFSVIDNILQEI
ncbi:N-acetylglucosaminyltransferase [Wickerhamomyces ciferrii]|uniref:UDP-N-acetylglucosamine transferase subunit ALG13 n=1 Tax=Wickerhamomyces ciferrii (strain ATCC 14091 / BCRC 22168 / CBS 111 / JCM 3599 / NBRC 0793 / NRRL Y-1031 F-60-10) TaxID=1206466 RepID=K0KXE8_WICCF|nr:N-acetylglucosaminyltransferase [Wickerhamomyces ciferrii]CCH46712.1 N-acetylglucosaminyltransferase [Wickerhamomyces ciferrii]